MDPSWKKKADKETKEYQIIMVFLMIAFGCSGSPGLFSLSLLVCLFIVLI